MGNVLNRGGLLILLALSALLAGCSRRADYPSRPISLICPWSAGGGTDRVSRQVAVLLEDEIGVPVNVINATGGSGVTGHTRGALATPDGYTLTMMTVELNMLHWRGLTNISRLDFEPLVQLNRDDAALFVRIDAPWKSPKELAKAIAESPQPLKASGTAQGGIWHVSLAGWLDAIGLKADDVTWISINGSAPSLQELISGGVQMVCCSLPEAQTLLSAGEVRCLGVMADARVPGFLDVPTFREQGENWSIGGWRGLALPLGVPAERSAKLTEALERVVASDPFRKFMDSNGFNTSILPPQAFAKALAEDDARFEAILTGDAFRTVRKARYGPYVFPWILAGAMALTLVTMLVKGGVRRPVDVESVTVKGATRVALAIGWVLAFVFLIDVVGYVLTASGLLLALFLALRVRPTLAVPLALVLAPLTYQVFAVALRVPLPVGWLGW
ncbi:MAG: tripartite tricarboxylate transporter substrate-binding protein [Isosphaeraceae bacterium]